MCDVIVLDKLAYKFKESQNVTPLSVWCGSKLTLKCKTQTIEISQTFSYTDYKLAMLSVYAKILDYSLLASPIKNNGILLEFSRHHPN